MRAFLILGVMNSIRPTFSSAQILDVEEIGFLSNSIA